MRRHFADSIPHVKEIGLCVTQLSAESATVELPYRPEWLGDTQRGLIHTGIVTTMVDSVCGLAVFAAQGEYRPIATLDLRMDYLRPAVPGKTLYCRAEVHRLTRSIAFVRASAWQDSQAEPFAVSQCAFMLGTRKGRP